MDSQELKNKKKNNEEGLANQWMGFLEDLSGAETDTLDSHQGDAPSTRSSSSHGVTDDQEERLKEKLSGLFEDSKISETQDFNQRNISVSTNYGLSSAGNSIPLITRVYGNGIGTLPCGHDLSMMSSSGLNCAICRKKLLFGDDSSWIELEHKLFHLVNTGTPIRDDLFNLSISKIANHRHMVLIAAFDKHESYLLAKLVKKLKRTMYCSVITKPLASRFVDVMIHPFANSVARACFDFFRYEDNELLYIEAIKHFREIAITRDGCLSLNECINSISGEYKKVLIQEIATFSSFLSHDPYGNFVVQHVLDMKDFEVNEHILFLLKDEFVRLAHKKGGSHVVEKCLHCLPHGTEFVVKCILSVPNGAFLLAASQYGNYVMQKAIYKIVESKNFILLDQLTGSLKPHYRELRCSLGGKSVIDLIEQATEAMCYLLAMEDYADNASH